MIVTPKMYPAWAFNEPTLKTLPSDEPHALVLECEGVSPRSAVGRTVYVTIPVEQITPLLLEVRNRAMAMRR